jgi:hypothetical protein
MIEPNKTKALAASSLFTAAWQHPCLHAWARALATCWGIQLMRVSFTQLAATMISGLLTSSTSTSPRCSARGEWAWELEGLGLFNIQATLPSSEISSEIDKNKELIWPEVEKCRW